RDPQEAGSALGDGRHELVARLTGVLARERVAGRFLIDVDLTREVEAGLVVERTHAHEVAAVLLQSIEQVAPALGAESALGPLRGLVAAEVAFTREVDRADADGERRRTA